MQKVSPVFFTYFSIKYICLLLKIFFYFPHIFCCSADTGNSLRINFLYDGNNLMTDFISCILCFFVGAVTLPMKSLPL